MLRVAFYKAIRPGIAGIYSHGVRIVTKSIYSHCELIFTDIGDAASASYMDKGVRFKKIDFTDGNWDFIDLPDSFAENAWKWFEEHEGQPYDLLGNLHFVISVVGDDKEKWFCSEAIAASLGMENAWRFDPGTLYEALKLVSVATMPK
jgi:hypothetical protein